MGPIGVLCGALGSRELSITQPPQPSRLHAWIHDLA